MKKHGLTATHLKIIAICAMLLDHIIVGISIISHDTVLGMLLRIPGRITAPIMCYMVSEGYHFTSNKKKYLGRLFFFAVLSHIPYNLCMGTQFPVTGVMWSLTLGLLALILVKKEGIHLILRLIGVGLCVGLSYYANWNFVGVLWIVFFGIYRGNFKKQIVSFCVIGLLLHIVPTFTYLDYGLNHEVIPHWYQIFIIAAVPLLSLYNGKRGTSPRWMSQLFYWFYPAHLLAIYLIDCLIG